MLDRLSPGKARHRIDDRRARIDRYARFGGLGMMLCPGVGELMAGLVANGEIPLRARRLMAVLSPARA